MGLGRELKQTTPLPTVPALPTLPAGGALPPVATIPAIPAAGAGTDPFASALSRMVTFLQNDAQNLQVRLDAECAPFVPVPLPVQQIDCQTGFQRFCSVQPKETTVLPILTNDASSPESNTYVPGQSAIGGAAAGVNATVSSIPLVQTFEVFPAQIFPVPVKPKSLTNLCSIDIGYPFSTMKPH